MQYEILTDSIKFHFIPHFNEIRVHIQARVREREKNHTTTDIPRQ
jgi:hypothetical protein